MPVIGVEQMTWQFGEIAQRMCRELAMKVQEQNKPEASAEATCPASASTAPPTRPKWPAHRRFWHRPPAAPKVEPEAPRPAPIAPSPNPARAA